MVLSERISVFACFDLRVVYSELWIWSLEQVGRDCKINPILTCIAVPAQLQWKNNPYLLDVRWLFTKRWSPIVYNWMLIILWFDFVRATWSNLTGSQLSFVTAMWVPGSLCCPPISRFHQSEEIFHQLYTASQFLENDQSCLNTLWIIPYAVFILNTTETGKSLYVPIILSGPTSCRRALSIYG